jgi:WD40 repeat protein
VDGLEGKRKALESDLGSLTSRLKDEADRFSYLSYRTGLTESQRLYQEGGYDWAADVLSRCPELHRGWEWQYLARTQKQKRRLVGHPKEVRSLTFSPKDPHLLASASWDGTVNLWDLNTDRSVHTLSDQSARDADFNDLAFHPNGDRLAWGRGGTPANGQLWGELRVWDPKSGRPIEAPTAPPGAITGVAFSPDGKLFACGICRRAPDPRGNRGRVLRGV